MIFFVRTIVWMQIKSFSSPFFSFQKNEKFDRHSNVHSTFRIAFFSKIPLYTGERGNWLHICFSSCLRNMNIKGARIFQIKLGKILPK